MMTGRSGAAAGARTARPATWEEISPAEAGADRVALREVVDYCARNDTAQLLILQAGRILVEEYWGGAEASTSIDVASVQKSAVCLLVLMLCESGAIGLENPVSQWLGSGWTRAPRDAEDAIRIRHLMSMSSGLYDDLTLEAPPGSVWYYNNMAYHQLRKVIAVAGGVSFERFFDERLARPLGMQQAHWRARTVSDVHGHPLAGLFASAHDLGRLGLAVLDPRPDAGLALGQRSLAWAMTSSQELNPSYGHLWWLPTEPYATVPDGVARDPRKSFGGRSLAHPIAPAAPAGLVAAFGAGIQRLYLSADRDLVVVRLGRRPPAGAAFDDELWRRLARALPGAAPGA